MNKFKPQLSLISSMLSLLLLVSCAEQRDSGTATAMASLPAAIELTAPARHMPGFIDSYWRDDTGSLYLQLRELDQAFLYVSWLARGVGSNDLGLDRGQLGSTRVVRFQRVGPRVLLVQDNLGYLADSAEPAERSAVTESFAVSVLASFAIAAQPGPGGALLIDATDFFLRDAHGVGAKLAQLKEGDYLADASLSAIFLPRTRSFPDNTEVEAIVTLTGKPTGKYLKTVVPDPTRVSVHVHHSLVRLPGPGYEAVPFEPRAGFMDPVNYGMFNNYATSIEQPLQGAWLPRHRLAKRDPQAALSEPLQPIVYYLDRGVPEPVRSALLEGAGWWNQAFEAAGYKDAFQVRLLPEGADPMDVRYNVIQWVHRSTRGWSYGASVRDPRSGEIIKGHVSLGSLRVRQDYLLAEGLLAPYGAEDLQQQVEEFALARLRQLSAHEVGHTLGLEHNFAASANDRASVMDYPHPLLSLDEAGKVDVSDAYAEGIGNWDKRAILFGYQDFPANTDRAGGRGAILAETLASGLLFIGDANSRSVGSAHPQASLWDNGSNAIDELQRLLQVRAAVLANFSEYVIREGRPLASMEEVLVPMYLLHRYQLQAAGKFIGGQYFSYAMRGDGQQPATRAVPTAEQERALAAILATLQPQFLQLSPALLRLLPPRPPGHPANRELLARSTGDVFDPLAAAAAASQLSLQVLLNPQRAARMNRLGLIEPAQPGFSVVLQALLEASWRKGAVPEQALLQQLVNTRVLQALLALAADPQATEHVRAQVFQSLSSLNDWLQEQEQAPVDWQAHYRLGRALIKSGLAKPVPDKQQLHAAPPGSPIGSQ